MCIHTHMKDHSLISLLDVQGTGSRQGLEEITAGGEKLNCSVSRTIGELGRCVVE